MKPACVARNCSGYRQKLLAAIAAQNDANAEAREAREQEEHSRPFGQPAPASPAGARPVSAPPAAEPQPAPSANAPTMAERARIHYGQPPAAQDDRPADSPQAYGFVPAEQALAAAVPARSFSDAEMAAASAQSVARMRARHGAQDEAKPAAARSPAGKAEMSGAERMAARYGISLDAARREPEPASAALLPSRSDR